MILRKYNEEMKDQKQIKRIYIVVLLILLIFSPLLGILDANISAAYDNRNIITLGELSLFGPPVSEYVNEIILKDGV